MVLFLLFLVFLRLRHVRAFRSTTGQDASKAAEIGPLLTFLVTDIVPGFHLTFDDGPNLEHGPHLLDVLKKHHVQATFFFVGVNIPTGAPHHSEEGLPPPYLQTPEQIRNYKPSRSKSMMPSHVRHIARAGHIVASHTMKHWNKYDRFPDVFEEDVLNMTNLLHNVTGNRPVVFRAPYGKANGEMHNRLEKLGYMIDLRWKVDLRDWKCGDTAKNQPISDEEKERLQRECVVSAFKTHYPKGGRGGGVVLLHQSKHTSYALDEVLTYLKSLDYNFLPFAAYVRQDERDQLWESYNCEKQIEDLGEEYLFYETCRSFRVDYDQVYDDLKTKRNKYMQGVLKEQQEQKNQLEQGDDDHSGNNPIVLPLKRAPSQQPHEDERPREERPRARPSSQPEDADGEGVRSQDLRMVSSSLHQLGERVAAQSDTLDRLSESMLYRPGDDMEILKHDIEKIVDEKVREVHRGEADKLYVLLEDRLTRDDVTTLIVVASIVLLGLCWFCAFRMKKGNRRGLPTTRVQSNVKAVDSPV